jgi:hypothetical protein
MCTLPVPCPLIRDCINNGERSGEIEICYTITMF